MKGKKMLQNNRFVFQAIESSLHECKGFKTDYHLLAHRSGWRMVYICCCWRNRLSTTNQPPITCAEGVNGNSRQVSFCSVLMFFCHSVRLYCSSVWLRIPFSYSPPRELWRVLLLLLLLYAVQKHLSDFPIESSAGNTFAFLSRRGNLLIAAFVSHSSLADSRREILLGRRRWSSRANHFGNRTKRQTDNTSHPQFLCESHPQNTFLQDIPRNSSASSPVVVVSLPSRFGVFCCCHKPNIFFKMPMCKV